MRSSRQFSFLNGPNKLVFVRLYESTTTGLVGPLFACSVLCFYLVESFSVFGAFSAFVRAKFFRKKKLMKNLKLSQSYQGSFKPVYFFFYKNILHAQKQ